MEVAAGSSRFRGLTLGLQSENGQTGISIQCLLFRALGVTGVCVSPAYFSISEAGFSSQLEENAC